MFLNFVLLIKIGSALFSGDSKKFQKSLSDFEQSGFSCSVTSPYFSCEACGMGQVFQRDGGISVCPAF